MVRRDPDSPALPLPYSTGQHSTRDPASQDISPSRPLPRSAASRSFHQQPGAQQPPRWHKGQPKASITGPLAMPPWAVQGCQALCWQSSTCGPAAASALRQNPIRVGWSRSHSREQGRPAGEETSQAVRLGKARCPYPKGCLLHLLPTQAAWGHVLPQNRATSDILVCSKVH